MSYIERTSIRDNLQNEVEVGVFGELKVANVIQQITHTFDHPLSASHLKTSGTVATQHNRSLLKVDSNSSVQTQRVLRYRTAQTVEAYFTAGFVGDFETGESYIGLFDSYDGVFLGYKDGEFVCGYRNVFSGATSSWDGSNIVNGVPDTIQVVTAPSNVDKITRYRIRFGYLGVGNIAFEYFNGTKWVLLHIFRTDNSLFDRTHVGSMILPIKCQVGNSIGSYIVSGSWGAGTYGPDPGLNEEPYFTNGSRNITPTTTGTPLVAFRSKETLGNYPSRTRSRLLYADYGTGSEGLYHMEVYKFAKGTLGGSATWNDITANTALQVSSDIVIGDIAGGLASGELVFATSLAASTKSNAGSSALDFERLGLIANPSDEFAIVMKEIIAGAGTNTTSWAMSYEDLF